MSFKNGLPRKKIPAIRIVAKKKAPKRPFLLIKKIINAESALFQNGFFPR